MSTKGTQVVTRIAPSPTGLFHIGTARSALFNWLYARKHNGRFVVRIEDTDSTRSKKEYERDILEGLMWLGLAHDELVRQSERTTHYTDALDALIASGAAYVSKETAKNDTSRTVEVVRLRNAGKSITFTDEVRGDISFETQELGDFVIARSRTDPLYHLAVVVDDAQMGITHVIRGEDHISNTPRQILIQEALGLTRPVYAHLPLILAPDRSKLSKRKGAVSLSEYRAQGYLPEALVNYLALLGWNPGTEEEIFTISELVQRFSLSQVQKAGAVFDIEKLSWLQREHRDRLDQRTQFELFTSQLDEDSTIHQVFMRSPAAIRDVVERYATSGDFLQAVEQGEFSFYETRPTPTVEQLTWKKDPTPDNIKQRLQHIVNILTPLESFTQGAIKNALWSYAEKEGKGNVLWPMRVALSGKERSPDPFLLAEALGKEEALARISAAMVHL